MVSAGISSVTTIAAQVWQAAGAELVIFVVTLFFALLLRNASWKPVAKASPKVAKSSPEQTEKKPRPPNASNQRSGRNAGFEGGRPQKQFEEKVANKQQGSALIDEACEVLMENSSLRSCNRVLQLYGLLCDDTNDSIVEIAKNSKHTLQEFYSTVAHSAIRLGKPHLVESIVDNMTKQGVSRPLTFYESLMKQLAGQKHYQLALAMYDRLVVDGLEPSAVTCSCLISFASEIGEDARAIQFFNKLSAISTPSIRAYMTILRVHGRRQDWTSSLATLRDMQRREVPVDSLVVNIILATGVASDQMDAVETLVQEVGQWTPAVLDVVSYNTLIKGHAQRNVADKALQVISRMKEKGLTPNAITFNTTMDAAVRSAKSKEAWNLLKEMYNLGLKPDKFTASVLIKGLQKSPCAEHVGSSLELLLQIDSTVDVNLKASLYHTVLETAGKQSDTNMLMRVFTQMQQQKVVPSTASYRMIVQALGQEGDVNQCKKIWQQMIDQDMRPTAAVFIALIEAHLKQGDVEGALSSFEALRSSFKAGARGISQALLEECRVGFIRGLCRMSREPEATHLYASAKIDGTAVSIDSATRMMLAKVQADAGSLTHAWTTIEDMVNTGNKPNESTIHSFLSSCLKHNQSQHGQAVFNMIAGQSMSMSQATYGLLIKLHASCGQVQEALLVYELMTMKQGIEPTTDIQVLIMRVCFQCRWPEKAFEMLWRAKRRTAGKAPVDGKIYRAAICGAASAGLVEKGVDLVEEGVKDGVAIPSDCIEFLANAAAGHGPWGPNAAARLQRIIKA